MSDLLRNHALFTQRQPTWEEAKRLLKQFSPIQIAFDETLKSMLATSSFRPAEFVLESIREPKALSPRELERQTFFAHFRKPNPSMDSKES